MRRLALGLPGLLVLALACGNGDEPDAYGNFEADDVVLSAETPGPILLMQAEEGARVAAGSVLAVVDTVPLSLERRQLLSQREVLRARVREVEAQLRSIDAQAEIATRNRERTDRLRADAAATAAQADAAEREVRVLAAQRLAAEAAASSLGAELRALETKLESAEDRLRRATLRAPFDGTVLATYARSGETIQPGQPLLALADLRTLTLRAYVTGDQLASFQLGQGVSVHADAADGVAQFAGTVAWVSSKAEFTPTPVQTRSERSDLVYAVKVRVEDPDGRLKIGMPGDLNFREPDGSPR